MPLAIAIALLILGAGAASARTVDQSTAYQLDAAHDGATNPLGLTGALHRMWSHTFAGGVSYPLVVNGTVYVTAPTSGSSYGTTLYALAESTGAQRWAHGLGGTYYWSGITYDAGRVFAVTYDGLLTAFDAASGRVDWSVQLPNEYSFSSPPTAIGGIVYDVGAGEGGYLYATGENTGKLLWSQSVDGGDDSSPAVDANHVYVTFPDNYYAFDRTTGKLAWLDALGGDGGGGRTPVVADGHVFIRDWTTSARIVSASDGALQGPLGSSTAPAVAGGVAYEMSGNLVPVTDDGLGSQPWTFAGDGHLVTAPLVTGSTVWVGSSSGELYAVNGKTGAQIWSTNVGSPMSGPDEQSVSQPLTGLGAGNGGLFVPAGDVLVAYGPADSRTAPSNLRPPSIGGQPVAGEQIAADVGVWSNEPSSYTYQWQLCSATGAKCAAIKGASSVNFVLTRADVGSTLRVLVGAKNPFGTGSPVESPPTAVIKAASGRTA